MTTLTGRNVLNFVEPALAPMTATGAEKGQPLPVATIVLCRVCSCVVDEPGERYCNECRSDLEATPI